MSHIFSFNDQVRLNETDLSGIVYHANYVMYMANARHHILTELGLDFADLHEQGITLVVAKIDISYLSSLLCPDHYRIDSTIIQPKAKRLAFEQTIIRSKDNTTCAKALVTIASVNRDTGRPMISKTLLNALAPYIST